MSREKSKKITKSISKTKKRQNKRTFQFLDDTTEGYIYVNNEMSKDSMVNSFRQFLGAKGEISTNYWQIPNALFPESYRHWLLDSIHDRVTKQFVLTLILDYGLSVNQILRSGVLAKLYDKDRNIVYEVDYTINSELQLPTSSQKEKYRKERSEISKRNKTLISEWGTGVGNGTGNWRIEHSKK